MKELFLACALALPSDSLADYKLLVQFIHKFYPGCEIVLGESGNVPFTFNGQNIFLRKAA